MRFVSLLLVQWWCIAFRSIMVSDDKNDTIDWVDLKATYEGYFEDQKHHLQNSLDTNDEDISDPPVIPVHALNEYSSLILLPLSDCAELKSHKKAAKLLVAEPPPSHGYQLTVTAKRMFTSAPLRVAPEDPWESGYTIHLYAVDLDSAIMPLNRLLQWLLRGPTSIGASREEEFAWHVSLRAFPTQPRQRLPPLTAMSFNVRDSSNPLTYALMIHRLHLQYFTIDHPLLRWIDNQVYELELTQCTVLCDWNRLLRHYTDDAPPPSIPPAIAEIGANFPRRALRLSCSLPEFIKFIPFLRNCEILTHLSLVLHFCLPEDPIMTEFGQALSSCLALTEVFIQYLDISDQGWTSLCSSLSGESPDQSTLRHLSFSYTDDFVDNYRRLTDYRRTERTQAILNLVKAVPTLCDVTFPLYQQDAVLMERVAALLNERTGTEQ